MSFQGTAFEYWYMNRIDLSDYYKNDNTGQIIHCQICRFDIQKTDAFEHTISKRHKYNKLLVAIAQGYRINIDLDFIVLGIDKLQCRYCNFVIINSEREDLVVDHMQDSNHVIMREYWLSAGKEDHGNEYNILQPLDTLLSRIGAGDRHVEKPVGTLEMKKNLPVESKLMAEATEGTNSTNENEYQLYSALRKEYEEQKGKTLPSFIISSYGCTCICMVCRVPMPMNIKTVSEHIDGKKHNRNNCPKNSEELLMLEQLSQVLKALSDFGRKDTVQCSTSFKDKEMQVQMKLPDCIGTARNYADTYTAEIAEFTNPLNDRWLTINRERGEQKVPEFGESLDHKSELPYSHKPAPQPRELLEDNEEEEIMSVSRKDNKIGQKNVLHAFSNYLDNTSPATAIAEKLNTLMSDHSVTNDDGANNISLTYATLRDEEAQSQEHVLNSVNIEKNITSTPRDILKQPYNPVLHNNSKKYINNAELDILEAYMCTTCGITVSKHERNIEEHINGKRHKANLLLENIIAENVQYMSTHNSSGHIRIVGNQHFCQVCNKFLPQESSIMEHINTEEHREKISAPRNSTENGTYMCPTCGITVSNHEKTMEEHLNSKRHKANLKLEKIVIENAQYMSTHNSSDCISIMGNQHFCKVCDKFLPEKSSIMEHIGTKKHKKKTAAPCNNTENGTFMPTTCGKSVPNSEKNIEEHINGKRNKANILEKIITENAQYMSTHNLSGHIGLVGNQHFCKVCNKSLPKKSSIMEHINTVEHTAKFPAPCHNTDIGTYMCPTCGITVSNHQKNIEEHINGKRHKANLLLENIIAENVQYMSTHNSSEHIRIVGNQHFCQVCDKFLPQESSIMEHINTEEHREKISAPCNSTESGTYMCPTCGIIVPNSKKNIEEHINGKRHKANLKLEKTIIENEQYMSPHNSSGHIRIVDNQHFCQVCNKFLPQESSIMEHINTEEHREKFPAPCNNTDIGTYMCTTCDIRVSIHGKTIEEHMNGKRHKANLKLEKTIIENEQYMSTHNSSDCISIIGNQHFCKVCDKFLPEKSSIMEHIGTKKHKEKTSGPRNIIENGTYMPTTCGTSVPNHEKHIEEHINGQRRKANLLLENIMAENVQYMSTHNSSGHIRIVGNQHFCQVCDKFLPEDSSIAGHINTEEHREKIPAPCSITENETYMCTTSGIRVPNHETNIEEHMNGERHEANLLLQNIITENAQYMSTHNLSGHISIMDNQHFCKVGDKFLPEKSSITGHIDTEKHNEKIPISRNGKTNDTHICMCGARVTNEINNMEQHENGKKHKKYLLHMKMLDQNAQYLSTHNSSGNISTVAGQYFCQICSKFLPGNSSIFEHINTIQHEKKISRSIPAKNDSFMWTRNGTTALKQKQSIGKYRNGINHKTDPLLTEIITENAQYMENDNSSGHISIIGNRHFCEVCNMFLPENNTIIKHINTEEHREKFSAFLCSTEDDTYLCTCGARVTNLKHNIEEHNNGKKHKKYLLLLNELDGNAQYLAPHNSSGNISSVRRRKFCEICNKFLPKNTTLTEHINTITHKKKISTNLSSAHVGFYTCICDAMIPNRKPDIKVHKNGRKHKKNLQLKMLADKKNRRARKLEAEFVTLEKIRAKRDHYVCQICCKSVPNCKDDIQHHMKGKKHNSKMLVATHDMSWQIGKPTKFNWKQNAKKFLDQHVFTEHF